MFLTYTTDPRSIYRPFARKQICKCFIFNYWQTVAGGQNVWHYQSKIRKLVLQETCRLSENLFIEYIFIKNVVLRMDIIHKLWLGARTLCLKKCLLCLCLVLLTLPIMLKVFPYYADNYATSYSHIQSRSRKNNNFIQCNINLGTVT
jgi:hypothetical protein